MMQLVIFTVVILATWCIIQVESVDFPGGQDECVVNCKTEKGAFTINSVPKKNLCIYTKGKKGKDFTTDIKVQKTFDYCQMCVELKNVAQIKVSYMTVYSKKVETITYVPKELCLKKSDLNSMSVTYTPQPKKAVIIVDFVFGCCDYGNHSNCIAALQQSNVGPLLLAAFHKDGLVPFESTGCSCESPLKCSCCAGITKPVKLEVCGIIELNPSAGTLTVTLTFNGNVIKQWTISVQNPPPLCVPIPGVPFSQICAEIYNVMVPPPKFGACLRLQVKMFGVVIATINVGCF